MRVQMIRYRNLIVFERRRNKADAKLLIDGL